LEIIENIDDWRREYTSWQQKKSGSIDNLDDSYPIVSNKRSPFAPARRALPMMNLGLISSAGAYIDGTDPFDTSSVGGDLSFREIPSQISLADIRFSARGYDPSAVQQDANAQLPLARLFEFEGNGIIGQLNHVFWSFSGFIPDADRLTQEMIPRLLESVARQQVQAVLLIPASRLCHQSVSLIARALELNGIPTMTLAVALDVAKSVRPPRAAFYGGELGSVAGLPGWPEYQRRVLDEALRLIEPMDQPGVRKLGVEMETLVENTRGER
jgi:D-proline reductase (dithiol) PrdB